jgi:peptidoglycan-associated lipoprotein
MNRIKFFSSYLLLSLLVPFLMSSCASQTEIIEDFDPKPQTVAPIVEKAPEPQPVKEEPKIEEPKVEVKEEVYETFENEQQVNESNRKIEEKVEEIEVKDRVFFGYDSFDINTEAKEILDVQAAWLASDIATKIIIEGHCDERGTREYNIALGEKRANSVKKYLSDKGIAKERIKIVSYGKERPEIFGADEISMGKNRRAVTVVDSK